MNISYINTDEVDNIAKDINGLANEFENQINKLFRRFAEVPMGTREWFGEQAVFYFNKVAQDKKQYLDLANKLREISRNLYMGDIETKDCLKKNMNREYK